MATDLPALWFTGMMVKSLDKGPAAPHIEHLGAETNSKDRFIEIMSILNQEFVDIFACRIGGRGGFKRILAVLLGVHICWGCQVEEPHDTC